MARKIEKLSAEDIKKIVKLRDSGKTWEDVATQVHSNTKTVQRAYKRDKRQQVEAEMEVARLPLKQEALSEHIRDLVWFAQGFAASLGVPEVDDFRDLEKLVAVTLRDPALVRRPGERDLPERDRQIALERKNKILHGSLMQHAASTSFERDINEYGRERDKWFQTYGLMLERIRGVLAGHLEASRAGRPSAHESDAVVALARGITGVLRAALLEVSENNRSLVSWREFGKWDADALMGRIAFDDDARRVKVSFGHPAEGVGIRPGGPDTLRHVEEAIKKTMNDIVEDDAASDVREQAIGALVSMWQCRDRLLGQVDELRLEPLLLKTRCDMCPM